MKLIDVEQINWKKGCFISSEGEPLPIIHKIATIEMLRDWQEEVNAIPIPDGETNRDVIKELWHDETLLSNIEYCYGKEWLNAPYEGGKEE